MKTPLDQYEVGQRIYTLAKRLEKKAMVSAGYSWMLEDLRELTFIGFGIVTDAKEQLLIEATSKDKPA